MNPIRSLFMIALIWTSLFTLAYAQNAKYVDPFLGSDGGGNVFPGASLPFAMVKPGPDVGDNTSNSGWEPNAAINGFSQTHVSGTGGGAKYGNILVQPTTGAITPTDHGSLRSEEQASVGFYAVTLLRYGIHVEVTSTRRTAVYRFTYPASSTSHILVDAGHALSSCAPGHEDQSITASSVQILSPTEIVGSSSVTGGWNRQPNSYTVYFYAVTDTPAVSWGTWRDGQMHDAARVELPMPNSHTGAWLGFSTTSTQAVVMKVGISFISIQQAKSNVESETSGNDFDAIHASAVQAWDTALASVSIRDASADSLQQSYTALYHTMLMPVDRTGENPLWSSSEPYYDDFYAIWDTFRSSSPLLTILAEKRQTEIVRALVDIYRHDGWLPDARSGNYNGATQGGSNGDMVIVDAYLKHLPDIDWDTAYKAVINDAENTPLNQIKEGRGDLQDWRNLSYLSIEGVDRPASKHMEYAANDFAIALFAKGMGKSSDEAKYCKRAGNWINLWDGDASANGFRGFIWPRHRNGSWKDGFDPKLQGTWGGDNFYEGNSWTYSTYVPQDVAGLIRASGGNARFVERLDTFFSLPDGYDVGNEPGFLSPYLFVWAGRPDRTQYWIRTILAKSYHSGPTGLPGNDDSGAMSSWYAFGRLGFYPNAAQDEYLIGSPAFQWVQIHLANGKLFTIEALGASPEKPYIQSATWNGKPYERAWFTHEQLMQGGTLRFVMSSKPSSWALSEPPPSISTGSCDHKP